MRGELVSQFLTRFGAQPPISFELFSDQVLRSANSLSFGKRQLPTFDLANARYVLSFGTDFLGTWNSPVAQSIAYGHMRQGRPGIRGTFVQLEPRMSQTGANADQWIPLRPGTDGIVALGLAHTIMQAGLRPTAGAGRAGAMIEGWSGGLASYSPAEVERQTGVGAAKLERLARDLVEQQPSVVIVGGAAVAQTSGLFAALAVNALNALLGSIGEAGGLTFMPQIPSLAAANQSGPAPSRSVSALAANILGDFSGRLEGGERFLLRDAAGNPVDETRIFEDGWSDGGGSSLELRNADADHLNPDAWADSDESAKR